MEFDRNAAGPSRESLRGFEERKDVRAAGRARGGAIDRHRSRWPGDRKSRSEDARGAPGLETN